MKLTIVAVVGGGLALFVLFGVLLRHHSRSSPAPVAQAAVDSVVPIAVKVGDKVLIQGRVRAVLPHGKGMVIEIVPQREAR